MGGLDLAEESDDADPSTLAVGTCPGMCPASEFDRRKCQRRLHRLELGPSPSCQPDASLAVKEYSRPAAGKPPPRPEELRPPPVLLDTVRHLLSLDDGAKGDEAERCAFVTDRLRAVRLDLTLQRLTSRPCAIPILERALVFLLHAGSRLHAQPDSRFDAHLHREQVQESFAALRRAYRQGQAKDQGVAAASEPRFQALFLLYNLGSPAALGQVLHLPKGSRTSPDIVLALAIHWAFLERNFARFFRLASALPYLPSCALQPHLVAARRQALATFSHGFSARNCRYPLARLARMLALGGAEEAAQLCRAHGLTVVDDSVAFQKGSLKDSVAPEHPWPSCPFVEGKRGQEALLDLAERLCS
uniref:SAC3/GANP/THP3 conserved domain-containing protein n=1 Tax=Anolis carolinensis TaxID=28377 RepID=H9G7N9_ANOCA|nr:PREDICTED: SAC3 domain-containing protein 1 [Anolis carolinensis]|eukprot:XP_008122120.1 PREDICTED: SAC3 domain-containing protein 1 [Anolis carolinensis]